MDIKTVERRYFDITVTTVRMRNIIGHITQLFKSDAHSILVTKHGKPEFVIVSPEYFLDLMHQNTNISYHGRADKAQSLEQLDTFLKEGRPKDDAPDIPIHLARNNQMADPGFKSL